MTNPAPAACLNQLYSSKPNQRGGTLIAEDVTSLEEHRGWVPLIDAYRPKRCDHCQSDTLHGHGTRSRPLRMGDGWVSSEEIRRYRCVNCGAIWQVLPGPIARHLHHPWDVVQEAVEGAEAVSPTGRKVRRRVAARTLSRWARRLTMSALVLVQLYAASVEEPVLVLDEVTSRGELVDALAAVEMVEPSHKISEVAAWVHRLGPGYRLM